MLFIDGGFGLIVFALWIFCVVDVFTTDAVRCRNLPKGVWVVIVLLFFDLGAIAWLVAGHPWDGAGSRSLPYKGNAGTRDRFPEYDRPGRHVPTNPDDDEAFLSEVRRRAEQQRQSYEQRRRAELEAENKKLFDDRPE
ncbi:MAG: hypothetical protein JWO63_3355 [Frankiales bacterium]|nr:hypothetical protein [Frankiales bacterium]